MPQQSIHAITHLYAHLDRTDELGALLRSLVEPTRSEQGCLRYELQQNHESPTDFVIVSTWRDPEAVQLHACKCHAQRVLMRLPKLVAAPIDIRFYRRLG